MNCKPVTLFLSGKLQLSSIVRKTYPNSSKPRRLIESACKDSNAIFVILCYFWFKLLVKFHISKFGNLYTWSINCFSFPGPKNVFQEDQPIGGVGWSPSGRVKQTFTKLITHINIINNRHFLLIFVTQVIFYNSLYWITGNCFRVASNNRRTLISLKLCDADKTYLSRDIIHHTYHNNYQKGKLPSSLMRRN